MESFEKQNFIQKKKEQKKETQAIRNEAGKRIETAIYKSGHNQSQLAKELNIHKSVVCAWCSGTQQPNSINIKKAVKVINKWQEENGEPPYPTSYFRVYTNCKNIENEEIHKKTKLTDEAIETIKKIIEKDSKTNVLFNMDTPLNHTNMINYLISQEKFFDVFYNESESILLEILKEHPHGFNGEKYQDIIKNLDINVPEKLNTIIKSVLNNYIKELLKSYFPQK